MAKGTVIPLPRGGDPTMAGQAAKEVFTAFTEWRKIVAREETNRAAIAAQRDVYIEQIRATREVMIQYLSASFEQQAKALDGLFSRLDTAMAAGDVNLVAPILSSIVETVKASPLGDLATLDQRMQANTFTFTLGRG